jgi:hypothetical protein
MRPGRFGAILVVVGFIAACEAHKKGSLRGKAAGDEMVCRNEPQTGSHIVEQRCYSRREIEARRARDIAVMERLIIEANRPVRSPAAGRPNPR